MMEDAMMTQDEMWATFREFDALDPAGGKGQRAHPRIVHLADKGLGVVDLSLTDSRVGVVVVHRLTAVPSAAEARVILDGMRASLDARRADARARIARIASVDEE